MADYSIEVSIPNVGPTGTVDRVISANDSSAGLRITQTGSGNALVVEDSANPDATPLIVNNVGQIISGATSAFNDFAGLQITADSSAAPNANIVVRRCSNDANCPSFAGQKARGTAAARVAVQNGDALLNIVAGGWDGTTTTFNSGRIQAVVDSAVSSGVVPTALVIQTGTNNAPPERMRITSAGIIGIGTAAPNSAALLEVASTTKGFLPPRMTTTERNAISTPPAGLMVYNSTTNKLNFYNGTVWEAVTSS